MNIWQFMYERPWLVFGAIIVVVGGAYSVITAIFGKKQEEEKETEE